MRRAGKSAAGVGLIEYQGFRVDREAHSVEIEGRHIDLTPSEFDLLAALISAPGRVFSRLELLDLVQGTAYEGYERTIDVHVKNLRAKIEPNPRQPRYVETVYGVGYRFSRQP
jgi:DNA-binding response OmpR family regulator